MMDVWTAARWVFVTAVVLAELLDIVRVDRRVVDCHTYEKPGMRETGYARNRVCEKPGIRVHTQKYVRWVVFHTGSGFDLCQ